jgi:hypothetical protein
MVFKYSNLAVSKSVDPPSAAGFDEEDRPNSLRTDSGETRWLMKLFYERYMADMGSQAAATAIGVSLRTADENSYIRRE